MVFFWRGGNNVGLSHCGTPRLHAPSSSKRTSYSLSRLKRNWDRMLLVSR